jgi:hypothetical protein
MRSPKCAPIAARNTRGDQAWAQPGVSKASATPTAAAVRRDRELTALAQHLGIQFAIYPCGTSIGRIA